MVTYITRDEPRKARLGALVDEAVVDLEVATTWAQGACGISREELPGSMVELIHRGPELWEYCRCVLAEIKKTAAPLQLKGAGRKPVAVRHEDAKMLAPLQPLSLRDFYAFEQHVRTAYANRGREVPGAWYRFPVFYFSNALAIYGPDDAIPYPSYSQALDYELEIAAVIGRRGRDIPPEHASDLIFGYTIFNDWSARDTQREEMSVGLGPAKGKDFASSLGPCIATLDEFEDFATDRHGVFNLEMTARVNGEVRSRGNFLDIHYSFGELLARASAEVDLYPAEVIGSGTVGTGCLLELTAGEGPWLKPGDVVELEIERIGKLTNTIVEHTTK